MIRVEGHKNLYRDEKSGAIVNCDTTSYNQYVNSLIYKERCFLKYSTKVKQRQSRQTKAKKQAACEWADIGASTSVGNGLAKEYSYVKK